ncbi:MAG: carboxy terminal-processing peptidase [Magnetococcus sp. WYHC-3]
MFFRKWMLPALVAMAVGVCAGAAPTGSLAPGALDGQIARQVARVLPAMHLRQEPLEEEISARAWTSYLNLLDFDHSYLLQSDIDALAGQRLRIGDLLRRGDVQLAYDVFNIYRQRVQERVTFVTNLLSQKLDFSVAEDYQWRRKDAPWPKDRAAQDDLWRRRIKNEYLSYVISLELNAARATNAVAAVAVTNPVTTASATNVILRAPPPPTPEEFVRKRYEQFQIVLQDADPEFVLSRYLGAVANAYDPHSEYMSAARMEDFNIDMSLSLCGIGAQLRTEDGVVKVEELIPGGPAARDTRDIRLRRSDKIIGVGQANGPVESVLHQPLSQTVRKIRGPKNTKVVLNVISASDPSGATTRLVDLIRDEVKLEAQAATGRVERLTMTNGQERLLGVIRLPAFYGTMQQRPGTPGYRSAALDVMRILGRLNAENVAGLVLDLRSNGGGSLRESVELAGAFIRSGPVVQVREVRQIQVLPIPDTDPAVAFRRPMVVLINRFSASAAEIVAGALQDYGRAVTVGDPQTHGKGSVQTILPLGDEKLGQLKVTTANYYRISGLSTQLRGVRPDIIIPSVFDTLDTGEDKLPNAMPWTCVPAVPYTPVWDFTKWLPKLRSRSAERLAKNTRYAAYCRLVQHLRELNERTVVSIEKKTRMEMAVAEREIQKMQDEELKVPDEPDSKEDLLLDEALHVLSDMIDVGGGAEIPWENKEDVRQQMLRMFGIGI